MERTLKIVLTLSGSRILKGVRKLWNVAWDLAVSVGEVCGSWRSQDGPTPTACVLSSPGGNGQPTRSVLWGASDVGLHR